MIFDEGWIFRVIKMFIIFDFVVFFLGICFEEIILFLEKVFGRKTFIVDKTSEDI